MGFIFGSMHECMVISSILSQQKTFFNIMFKQSISEFAQFFDLLYKYDYNQNSDVIIMMNIFKEWQTRFIDYITKHDQDEDDNINLFRFNEEINFP